MSPAAFSGRNLLFSHLLRRSAARMAQRAFPPIQNGRAAGLEARFYVGQDGPTLRHNEQPRFHLRFALADKIVNRQS